MPEVRVQTGFDVHYREGVQLGPDEEGLWDLVLKGREKGVPNRQRLLGQTLRELGLDGARLGFDDPRVMLELRENELAQADCQDVVNVFREIRVVKTEDELRAPPPRCPDHPDRPRGRRESRAGGDDDT